MDERPPDALTIEEAARVLSIGRTKAYAMSQELRATNGAAVTNWASPWIVETSTMRRCHVRSAKEVRPGVP